MDEERSPRTEPENDLDIEVGRLPEDPFRRANAPALLSRVSFGSMTTARRRRRQAGIVGVVLVALLTIGVSFYGAHLRALVIPPPVPPLHLLPQTAGMHCLLDAAWSPNGARIALLGVRDVNACPDGSLATRAGLMEIFDARTGGSVATILPDETIIPAVKLATGLQASNDAISSTIRYQHMLWSAGGQRLAVTFWLDAGPIGAQLTLPNGAPALLSGVLLVGTDGAHPRAMTELLSVYAQLQVEWDLAAARIIAAPTTYIPTNFGILTAALGYRWQPDGALAAQGPAFATLATLATTAPLTSTLGPVGMPDGGDSFTIWQPGSVVSVTRLSQQGIEHLAGAYFWRGAPLAAWSPDERYLLDGGAPAGLLLQPGTPLPSQNDLSSFDIGQEWALPVRDAGLAAILRTVNPRDQQGMAVAWRPDGRVVAAYTPHSPDGSITGSLPVTLYDCASGDALLTLTPEIYRGVPLNGQADLLRWSPDGTRLLLFDSRIGAPLVWGPAYLPR